MTDLRIDKDLAAKLLTWAAILALAAGLVFMFLPKQSAASVIRQDRRQTSALADKKKTEDGDLGELQKAAKARTWSCPQAEIGPGALASMTHLAKSHRLKLATFRPQKPVLLKGLDELPFLMAVEGSYIDIDAFLRELEKPATKLVPVMMQLSAGDQTTDKVTASITVAAFAEPQAPKSAAGSKSGSKTDSKAGAKTEGGSNGKTL